MSIFSHCSSYFLPSTDQKVSFTNSDTPLTSFGRYYTSLERLIDNIQKSQAIFMLKQLLAVLSILALVSCKEKLERVENRNEEGTLIEVYTRRVSDYAKEGLYIRYDDEGRKIEEAHYTNDTLQGERILFYESEKPHYLETYEQGLHDGPYKAYYESGEVKLEGQYVQGVMSGKWRGFYQNGQLKEVVNFKNNNENGPFVEYYPNGNLKAEGQYKDGDREHGLLKLYNEQGELKRKMECDQGRCHTIWKLEDGSEARAEGASI